VIHGIYDRVDSNRQYGFHWQAGHAAQSNLVSGSFLQKTATKQKIRGDFQQNRPKNFQIWDAEIHRLGQEARERRPFSLR